MSEPNEKLDKLLTLPQYALPHHLLSKLMYYVTRMPMGKLTPWLLQRFVTLYGVDLDSAESSDLNEYRTFNEFFTRALKAEARPIADNEVISPVDGTISQIGNIQQDTLIQAKQHEFNLSDLLGGFQAVAKLFQNGSYCTIYLSPKDYHRVHFPISSRPLDMIYVPGRLFSVNQRTARQVPNLFARNERVVCICKTPLGPMALILVGAIFVGSVDLVWEEGIMPNASRKPQRWQMPDTTPQYDKGAEIGRFNMGSTVIVLFGKHQVQWLSSLSEGDSLLMGQGLGHKA